MYAVTIYFFTFPTSKELYIFLKKDDHSFLSYTKHYLSAKKLAADNDAYLGWGW